MAVLPHPHHPGALNSLTFWAWLSCGVLGWPHVGTHPWLSSGVTWDLSNRPHPDQLHHILLRDGVTFVCFAALPQVIPRLRKPGLPGSQSQMSIVLMDLVLDGGAPDLPPHHANSQIY